MFTKQQLLKFIEVRNQSQHFSNLQFSIDADHCQIDLGDLGPAYSALVGIYTWHTPYGVLTEDHFKLSLEES